MDAVTIQVRLLHPRAAMPFRATPAATGFDLYACPPEESMEVGLDPVLVPTGIAIEVPAGFDAQVRPRSGLSRQGIIAAFGTIDSDYRGELLVTMYSVGSRSPYRVRVGDRIAQLVIAAFVAPTFVQVEQLSLTDRGAGGHGSTGS